jgi:hypothetical protein
MEVIMIDIDSIVLDPEEQEIEDNIENFVPLSPKEQAYMEGILNAIRAEEQSSPTESLQFAPGDFDLLLRCSSQKGRAPQSFVMDMVRDYALQHRLAA